MREQMACTDEKKRFRRILKYFKLRLYSFTHKLFYFYCNKMYFRSLCTAALKYLLWPVLPICGIIFTLVFFSIGIYVYKFQDMQHSALCIQKKKKNNRCHKLEALTFAIYYLREQFEFKQIFNRSRYLSRLFICKQHKTKSKLLSSGTLHLFKI